MVRVDVPARGTSTRCLSIPLQDLCHGTEWSACRVRSLPPSTLTEAPGILAGEARAVKGLCTDRAAGRGWQGYRRTDSSTRADKSLACASASSAQAASALSIELVMLAAAGEDMKNCAKSQECISRAAKRATCKPSRNWLTGWMAGRRRSSSTAAPTATRSKKIVREIVHLNPMSADEISAAEAWGA